MAKNREEANLGELFLAVAQQLRGGFRRVYEPLGLAPHQARALRVIHRDGPLRLGGLAEHLRIAARSATDVVDQLEQRGLVRRRADASDGRAVMVATTAAGKRLAEATEQVRVQAANEYFQLLAATDRAELGRILASLERSHSET